MPDPTGNIPTIPPQSASAPGVVAAHGTPTLEPSPDEFAFPIVGIGASAGGLEALKQFVAKLPPQPGYAVVVIQHLDPTHSDRLAELLQRTSTVPVVQITDQLLVERDRIYVLPPGFDVVLTRGHLQLLQPTAPRGLRLPIDFFFRSLAARQQLAIGVILSGMGADGTLGLRAIKEQAGASFVQRPEDAQFDSMPRSAINAGLADMVGAAGELPGLIRSYLEHQPSLALRMAQSQTQLHLCIDEMLLLLRAHTGRDFSQYKRSTIQRRIERRMGLHQLRQPEAYLRLLAQNPQELDLLFREMLIGVTSFFRDAAMWELLRDTVLPELIHEKPERSTIRAWVAGCSTGEEAYSLAIVLREAIAASRPNASLSVQIFATDLDDDAIERARAGVYPDSIAADVSAERLEKYFTKENSSYRIRLDVRETVVFAPQDMVMDPPFIKLDLLSCRNLLIYLDAVLQQKLMPVFHYALNPGGVLILGSAETVGNATQLFSTIDAKSRIYRRTETTRPVDLLEFPSTIARNARANGGVTPPVRMAPRPVASLQQLADSLLLASYTPAAVITTPQGDLLYVNGRTGRYLEPAAGRANLNVLAMARSGLRAPLHDAYRRALETTDAIRCPNVLVEPTEHELRADLTVQRLLDPEALRGMIIVVFAEPAPSSTGGLPSEWTAPDSPAPHHTRLQQLALELLRANETAQRLRDEMQTSQEQLRAANEELQSTNEEMQSTNEELTTSKEEMQSMNEELQTVNNELLSRVEELSRTSSDMRNLLNSTNIATLFLDGNLLVRRFTPAMTNIVKLIPGDVGRPITDLVLALEYAALANDAREVMHTLVYKETQVRSTTDNWYTVRIMPYQTQDKRIDGVVITFIDISVAKRLEIALRKTLDDLRHEVEVRPDAAATARRVEVVLRDALTTLQGRSIPTPPEALGSMSVPRTAGIESASTPAMPPPTP